PDVFRDQLHPSRHSVPGKNRISGIDAVVDISFSPVDRRNSISLDMGSANNPSQPNADHKHQDNNTPRTQTQKFSPAGCDGAGRHVGHSSRSETRQSGVESSKQIIPRTHSSPYLSNRRRWFYPVALEWKQETRSMNPSASLLRSRVGISGIDRLGRDRF